MSIAINTNKVRAVLLADGWHTVEQVSPRENAISSFDLDSYEYVEGDAPFDDNYRIILGGGAEKLVPATGFTFIEVGKGGDFVNVAGPLTAILAVRCDR